LVRCACLLSQISNKKIRIQTISKKKLSKSKNLFNY